jgi:acyl-CoA reductase-like NAD-dependent aldehyde dehydrogenase
MMEQWNPLGTVGVISAFNFPVFRNLSRLQCMVGIVHSV